MDDPTMPQDSADLPPLPAGMNQFVSHIASKPEVPMIDLLKPYREYDTKVRRLFAQQPKSPSIQHPYVNAVPVFDGYEQEIKIRARTLSDESAEERSRYLRPLDDGSRKPHGSPAVVPSLQQFQRNFNIFTENSLSQMNWNNVIAAGSSVTTALLPVPPESNSSLRALRTYYHQNIAPASDVDLFLYGLSEDEAKEKIKHIESSIQDAILHETTTVRSKHAVTIVSQYPTRHVQVVLRIYQTLSEALTGFDVDCSCVAYDGKQVWAAPRAVASFMTQTNLVDLSRRSPSYEHRLSKYSHRGFEAYWPWLDRSKIDPTVFERAFRKLHGLARLLVLEKLPTSDQRESYANQRREERGRPTKDTVMGNKYELSGDIKAKHEDEIAEWEDFQESDESNYHTLSIPYGEKFSARKIEKLLFTKDLLLNAEWNKPKDRAVNLHRHPAFIGRVEDILHDCCRTCPIPATDEEREIAEEEGKHLVAGSISFLRDNPGRQEIGSFHPITADDWTDMAYIGDTTRICQAIVDADLSRVEHLVAQELDVNCRDHCGRTPLHLAVQCSTPEVVQCLVNAGARMVARIADGRTSLHLAACRGDVEIVKILLDKSESNEEEEADKEERRRQTTRTPPMSAACHQPSPPDEHEDSGSIEEINSNTGQSENEDNTDIITQGSFVKVKKPDPDAEADEEDLDNPDIFDINAPSWDLPCSPLHFAIANGHVATVLQLVSYGADVLKPAKIPPIKSSSARASPVLTLRLTMILPQERRMEMIKALLDSGASCAQADPSYKTAFQHFVAHSDVQSIETLLQNDRASVQRCLKHLTAQLNVSSWWRSLECENPLTTAIDHGKLATAKKLLEVGSSTTVHFDDFLKSLSSHKTASNTSTDDNKKHFLHCFRQPLIRAVEEDQVSMAIELLRHGADPNVLSPSAHEFLSRPRNRKVHQILGMPLDLVRRKLHKCRDYQASHDSRRELPPYPYKDDEFYFEGVSSDSYHSWHVNLSLQAAKAQYKQELDFVQTNFLPQEELAKQEDAIKTLSTELETLEQELLTRGAKIFQELHPHEHEHLRPPEKRSWTWTPPEVRVSFSIPDLTTEKLEGYLQLFEAAWKGDLSSIQALTETTWGPHGSRAPLPIAVWDQHNQTVFSIALYFGHVHLLRPIVEIASQQYRPELEDRRHKTVGGFAGDSDSESDEVEILSESDEDETTVETIGAAVTQANSGVKPRDLINYRYDFDDLPYQDEEKLKDELHTSSDVFDLALAKNDLELFDHLLSLWEEFHVNCSEKEPSQDISDPFRNSDVFQSALTLDRFDFVELMISRVGSGLSLNNLVKSNGISLVTKSKFYQGLFVRGKKRTEWSKAAQRHADEFDLETPSPALTTALAGNTQALRWIFSEAPKRCYLEFASNHQGDERIQKLAQLKGGFQKAIADWFGRRHDLLTHCVLLRSQCDAEMLTYALKMAPHSLHTLDWQGYSPLHYAFERHHVLPAKLLLAAGADPLLRGPRNVSILHSLFTPRCRKSLINVEGVRALLDLLNPDAIRILLTQRPTPLQIWLKNCCSGPIGYETIPQVTESSLSDQLTLDRFSRRLKYDDLARRRAVLRLLLDSPGGYDALQLPDAHGDTPLHHMARHGVTWAVQEMLATRLPGGALTLRENAVGVTPLDVVRQERTDQRVRRLVENCNDCGQRYRRFKSVTDRRLSDFREDEAAFTLGPQELERTATLIEQATAVAEAEGARRRLVSLSEASEIVDRLSSKSHNRGYHMLCDMEDRPDDELYTWYKRLIRH